MLNAAPPQASLRREPHRVGFVLLPGFSLLALAGATEVLKATNELLGAEAFESVLLSFDGAPVAPFGGCNVSVSAAFAATTALSSAFIVAQSMPNAADARLAQLASFATTFNAMRGVLGGIGTGAAWWAQAGCMRGYRCTVPTAHAAALTSACPEAHVSSALYEIDRERLSCTGFNSSIDLLILWLGQRMGERMQAALLAHFALDKLRDPNQQPTARAAPPSASSKFAEAVALMQANLGEPLSSEDIADLVGVSRRQLERLFKQHLDTLPSRWYLEQRLILARRLLQESSQSILQVGLSCGFTSAAHFSNAYRNHFARTPRDERSARALAWRNAPALEQTPRASQVQSEGASMSLNTVIQKDHL
jgi:transcriptional regulator GlxA family with amidase domain